MQQQNQLSEGHMKRIGFSYLTILCVAAQLLFLSDGWGQLIHTAHDHIPNFAANPTISSASNGSWSSPGTWNPARVPGPSDRVGIRHTVTYDSTNGDADVIGIDVGGTLRFSTTQTTRLRVGTLIVLPNGTLEVGTSSNPIPPSVTAEIIIKNKALNLTIDPDQYGTGLLSVNGNITIHGGVKDPTWVRVAAEPRAGNASILLEQPVTGWRTGDLIVLPDSREDPTRNNDAQLERRTIQSISADQRTIMLSSPLTYTHPGARDQNGNIVLMPHVMNLTRNVVIRSESPSGTRGHTLYTDRANVDIRYAEFRDVGRTTISPLDNNTNHIGRYALHFHHLMGPTRTPANGYQFTAIGNAILDTNTARSRIKWPIAVHNSHYGLVQANTVFNAGGAGIVTEDGSESYNVIEGNAVFRVLGEGDRVGTKSNGVAEPGSQGVGFWFHGPNNYIRGNVAANSLEVKGAGEAAYGFEFFQAGDGGLDTTPAIPNFKGADTSIAGQYTTRDIYTIPILEFSNNETYGSPQGMTYWWLGLEFHTAKSTADSVIKDLRIWHTSRYPLYAYQGNRIVFDGLKVYGDPSQQGVDCCRVFWFGDYLNKDVTIKNSTFVGIGAVIPPYAVAGTTRIQNSFVATVAGISIQTSGAPGDCPSCTFPNRVQIIDNVRFGALPGRTLRAITMEYRTDHGTAALQSSDQTLVYSYQGIANNNFQVYYKEQATQNIAGGLAPCNDTTTRPEISGITCPMSGGTPPPLPTVPAAPSVFRVQ
jgi:hypothetical protein